MYENSDYAQYKQGRLCYEYILWGDYSKIRFDLLAMTTWLNADSGEYKVFKDVVINGRTAQVLRGSRMLSPGEEAHPAIGATESNAELYYIVGQMKNGDTVEGPTVSFWMRGNEVPGEDVPLDNMNAANYSNYLVYGSNLTCPDHQIEAEQKTMAGKPLTVSAYPFMNIYISATTTVGTDPQTYDFASGNASGENQAPLYDCRLWLDEDGNPSSQVLGRRGSFLIGIELRRPGGGHMKGVEFPDSSEDITFNIQINATQFVDEKNQKLPLNEGEYAGAYQPLLWTGSGHKDSPVYGRNNVVFSGAPENKGGKVLLSDACYNGGTWYFEQLMEEGKPTSTIKVRVSGFKLDQDVWGSRKRGGSDVLWGNDLAKTLAQMKRAAFSIGVLTFIQPFVSVDGNSTHIGDAREWASDSGRFDVRIVESNMHAKSISGDLLEDGGMGQWDAQTIKGTDDTRTMQLSSEFKKPSPGIVSTRIDYAKTTATVPALYYDHTWGLVKRDTGFDWAMRGSKGGPVIRFLHTNIVGRENWGVGYDFFIKFDDEFMQPLDKDNIRYLQVDGNKGGVKFEGRWVCKADGSGWDHKGLQPDEPGYDDDMHNTRIDDPRLVFFSDIQEAKRHGQVIGRIYCARGAAASTMGYNYKVIGQVKSTAQIDQVYACTYDFYCWNYKTIASFLEAEDVLEDLSLEDTREWMKNAANFPRIFDQKADGTRYTYADFPTPFYAALSNTNYQKTQYLADGSVMDHTNTRGDSCVVIGEQARITAKVRNYIGAEGGQEASSQLEDLAWFNIDRGQRIADFQLQPNLVIGSDDMQFVEDEEGSSIMKTDVTVTVTLPGDLSFIQDSAYFDGTYQLPPKHGDQGSIIGGHPFEYDDNATYSIRVDGNKLYFTIHDYVVDWAAPENAGKNHAMPPISLSCNIGEVSDGTGLTLTSTIRSSGDRTRPLSAANLNLDTAVVKVAATSEFSIRDSARQALVDVNPQDATADMSFNMKASNKANSPKEDAVFVIHTPHRGDAKTLLQNPQATVEVLSLQLDPSQWTGEVKVYYRTDRNGQDALWNGADMMEENGWKELAIKPDGSVTLPVNADITALAIRGTIPPKTSVNFSSAVRIHNASPNDKLNHKLTQYDLTSTDQCFVISRDIRGVVWKDLNHDGIRQSTEPRFSGVKVCLYKLEGQEWVYQNREQYTDAEGQYWFKNLQEGQYTVEFSEPDNRTGFNDWILTYRRQGSNTAIDSDAVKANGPMRSVAKYYRIDDIVLKPASQLAQHHYISDHHDMGVWRPDLTVTKTVTEGKEHPDANGYWFKLTMESVTANMESADGNYTIRYSDGTTGSISAAQLKAGWTFSLKDGESVTIVDLPADTAYTVTERDYSIFGYTTEKTEDTGILDDDKTASFVNTFTPLLVQLSAEKVWDTQDQYILENIKVQLLADDAPQGDAVVLSTANQWKHQWTDLQQYKYSAWPNAFDAEASTRIEINYSVKESGLKPGYQCAINNNHYAFTLTNTFRPAEVTFKATKQLTGRDWLQGDSFTFILQDENNVELDRKTATKDNPEVTFNIVALDAQGEYSFTIVEEVGSAGGITYDTNSHDVKVVVGVDASNALVVQSINYDNDNTLAIENRYNSSGQAVLGATKILENQTLAAEMFSFQLKDQAGKVLQTVKNQTDGSVVFAPLEYDRSLFVQEDGSYAGEVTLTYTITEVNENKPGYTYDGKTITATVTLTDDGEGNITAEVSYGDTETSFTNRYNSSGQAVLEAKKVLENQTLAADMFSFQLKDQAGKVIQTVKNQADGSVVFAPLTYDRSLFKKADGSYADEVVLTYTIIEVDEKKPGYTYDGKTITATVKLTDDGKGKITAAVGYENEATSFTNSYNSTGQAVLGATKILENQTLAAGMFSFQLKDQAGEVLQTVKNQTDGSVVFAPLSYDRSLFKKADGSYAEEVILTYTIIEVDEKKPGYTYDGKTITATVKLTDDGKGKITAAVSYENETTSFTNRYNSTGQAVLGAQKVLENQALAADMFSFQLKDQAGKVIQTVKNQADGSIVFAPLEYDRSLFVQEDGSYADEVTLTYTIIEVDEKKPGYTYDGKTITATVKLTDDGKGKITAAVSYENDETSFTNSYNSTGQAVLGATKILENQTLAAEMFSFQLKNKAGDVLQTVKNQADGSIVFAPLEYDRSLFVKEDGSYAEEVTLTYTIIEVDESKPGYIYDGKTITATVKLTDDGKGKITAAVGYENDETSFTNSYDSSGQAVLGATKILENQTLAADMFSFQLKNQAGKVIQTVKNQADGSVVFAPLEYDRSLFVQEGGSYAEEVILTYTIIEVDEKKPGYTYDGKTITATVKLTDDGKGKITAAVSYENDETIFTNSYNSTGQAVLEAQKILKNQTLAAGMFSFQLMDQAGVVLQTVKNQADGSVVFAPLEYDRSLFVQEGGSYAEEVVLTYTITEVNDNKPGYTYDEKVITATVTLTDDGKGNITSEVSYGDTETSFTNRYNSSGQAVLEAQKILKNQTLAAGMFSFQLMDQAGVVLQTVKNQADGSVCFAPLEYDCSLFKQEDGSYANQVVLTYTIIEVDEKKSGYTYDGKTITATVTLTDDGAGKILADIHYSDTAGFVNVYNPMLSIPVEKVWKDGDNQDGIRPVSVLIRLFANNQHLNDKDITLNHDCQWKGSFTNLPKFDDNGVEIQYRVEEAKTSVINGSDASGSYAILVKGTIKKGFVITNSHTPETVTVEGSKTWDDNNNQDGKRPDSITIRLLADGTEIKFVKVTEEEGWSWKFEALPKYKAGKQIVYSIKEDAIKDYSTTVKDYDVTNRYTPGKTSVTVIKSWDDKDNQDGKRPQSVTIQLLADGVKVEGKTLVLNADNKWEGTFQGLDEYKNGKKVAYTVEEAAVEGYTTTITGDATKGFLVTNSHTPETVTVEGSKTWDDNNNQDGKRPDSITIRLLADGTEIKFVKVTEEEGWSWKFEALPKYKAGKQIVYSIKEDAIKDYSTTVKDYDVTNRYTPGKTSVTVIKSWDDKDNQDGKRPQSVTIQLLADGVKVEGKTLVLNADSKWEGIFQGLDEYKNGKKVVYTVEEAAVENYTATITGDAARGFLVTNSYTPETVTVEGSKTWDDNNNQDGKRPESITIRLLANGTEIKFVKVTEKDGWSWKFEALPKYKAGKQIVYSIKEDAIKDYSTTVKDYDVTNRYTPGKTSVTVIKSWDDKDNQDGKRPQSVTIQLLADGVKVEGITLVLNADSKWEGTFQGLDEYKNGKKVKYTVEEAAVEGYTTTITGDAAKGFLVTNSYTPETVTVEGSKTWDDNNNQDGKRPESITIRLLADGTETEFVKVTEKDDWSWKFEGLPKYKAGKQIVYSIKEDAIKDYSTTVKDYDVTNRYTPGKTSVTVIKSWDDKDNQDGKRPQSVTIQLLADGVKVEGKTLVLNADNKWEGTFSGLDEYKNGKKVAYTVEEAAVEGYATTITGDATKGFLVTNSHTPETVTVEGSKTWDDNNNQDGKRPESITIRLLADGTEIKFLKVTGDDWSWKFEALPKYKAGKPIVYSIKEDSIKDYSTTVKDYDVTNRYTPGKTSVTVIKSWDDKDNQDGKRPQSVTIQLLADGVKVEGKTLVLNADNKWEGTFQGLDEYKNGKKVVYTVEEAAVEGYTTTITGDATKGFLVTNSHTPETVTVEGFKTWDDNNNQDGKRPESITIRLLADGTETEFVKVTEEDGWSWKFEGLPKYKDEGISIEYTITEDAVEEYNCEITGFNITNHHIPAKTSVEVSKVWDDAEDQDGKRPQSVTIQLLADGEHTGMILVLNADNEWKGIFQELDAYKNGKKVEYTVKEEAVKDYSTTITGDGEHGFQVVNSHTPEPPTEPPTEPSTEPPMEPPTEPSTEPSTEPPTEPWTEAPTEPETEVATDVPTEPEDDETDPIIPPDSFGTIDPEDPSNGTRVDDEAQGTTAETETGTKAETEEETKAETEVETQPSMTSTVAETTATLPSRAPDTGDGFNMGLYICLFTMSALTSGGLWMIRRKKEE